MGDTTATITNGQSGDDWLYGTSANDILDGGAGNDRLSGGLGNDTYLFYRGAGQDWISDYDSSAGNLDVIRVSDSLTPADIQLSRSAYDLYVGIAGSADKLTVSGWFSNTSTQVEQIQFSDGTTWGIDAIRAMSSGTASQGNDVLYGNDALADSLSGLDGDDEINGLGGNDILSGGAGNDRLYGDAGNDTLTGGTGNDQLDGGRGNDLYQFERGDGQDVINDFDPDANTDVLQFGAGIAADQLWFSENGWDLEVGVIGTADKVTVSNWSFWGAGSWEKAQQIEQFRTDDGKVLLGGQVDQLVEAMAAFAPPAAGELKLSESYQASLNVVIASNWQ